MHLQTKKNGYGIYKVIKSMDQGTAIQAVTKQKEEITSGAVSSCGSDQGVPHPGKTEVLKMFHIPGGKLLHPIMPQREGQSAIKNRVTPSTRLSSIFPNFFHQITRNSRLPSSSCSTGIAGRAGGLSVH